MALPVSAVKRIAFSILPGGKNGADRSVVAPCFLDTARESGRFEDVDMIDLATRRIRWKCCVEPSCCILQESVR
jgi:hypothetical protein